MYMELTYIIQSASSVNTIQQRSENTTL